KEAFDLAIDEHDFEKYQDKKAEAKKLGRDYDFFIAQANIMTKIAAVFGRSLGTRGKMPNPKAGCVVPPGANLKQLAERLQKTVKVSAKKAPVIQVKIGTEDMPDEDIAENIISLHKQLLSHLPKESHNIRHIYLKLTMSKPVKL
ncbi:MAG: 50S ribosomal protein L1, partial [Candidatus Woesearchaeota archaeon]